MIVKVLQHLLCNRDGRRSEAFDSSSRDSDKRM